MNARTAILLALLLWCLSFTLALKVDPWSQTRAAARQRSGSVLQMLLGDGRRLFANHFFLKADAYFHRGIYPGIFETAQRQEEMHMVTEGRKHPDTDHAGPHPEAHDPAHQHADEHEHEHDHNHDHDHPHGSHAMTEADQPKDWIARINRGLSPHGHEHLSKGDEREMLPWLRLAAELDPQQTLIYTTTAFWLRTHLGRLDEAEQFLREGLRHNPDSPEIYFELGNLYEQNHRDLGRARRLFEIALDRWQRQARSPEGAEPNEFLLEQILGHLATTEEATGQLPAALRYLEALRKVSPTPEAIDAQIRDLRARLTATNTPPATLP